MIKVVFLAAHLWFPNSSVSIADSLRRETIEGKEFIIHQVDEQETLYGISRRYGVTVAQVLEFNREADAGLDVGQILKVPYVPYVPSTKQSSGVHIVGAGETLFSISRLYNISVDELKSINNLKENSISVGQQLNVSRGAMVVTRPQSNAITMVGYHQVEAKQTLFSISREYGVTVQQLKEWNNLTSSELNIGQLLRVADPVQQTPIVETRETPIVTKETPPTIQESTVKISENIAGTDEVRESGLAELIEGTEGNRKYLALHRTAKVGTILKVRNELNNREVFVRVVGPIPSTGVNTGILIKISKSAFDRLGAIDAKFRAEVTYYK